MGEAKRRAMAVKEEADPEGAYVIDPAPDPDTLPEPEEQKPEEVVTAFLVLIEEDGAVTVTDDITTDVILHRPPTFDDIYAAMSWAMRNPTLRPDEGLDREVETGFIVRDEGNGSRWATNNINAPLILSRHPRPLDVELAAAAVMKDITVVEISNRVVMQQMQTAAAMAEQQKNAKIAAQLQSRGIHVPPGHRHR